MGRIGADILFYHEGLCALAESIRDTGMVEKGEVPAPGGLEGFLRHWERTPAEKPEPKQPEAEDRKPVGLAPAVNTFRRDGDIWEFSFNETTYRFPHLKGFEYLFEIIKRQGEKINALDLDAIVSPQSAIPKVNENLYQDEEGNSESGLSFRKGLRSELPILSEKEIKDLVLKMKPEEELSDQPAFDMTPRLYEKYNYILLFFKNELDFLYASQLLELKKMRDRMKPQKVGLYRGIDGMKAIELIKKSKNVKHLEEEEPTA